MNRTRSPFVLRSMAAMFLSCLLVSGLWRAAFADDSDLFRIRATPNVLLILDDSGSMGRTYGGSDVGDLDGQTDMSSGLTNHQSSRIDVAWRVLYQLLNADNSVATDFALNNPGGGTYPILNHTQAIDHAFTENITVADENKLKLRLGILVYGSGSYGAFTTGAGTPMKLVSDISGTDNNMPPFSHPYQSLWTSIKTNFMPGGYPTPMAASLAAARTQFFFDAAKNDLSVSCRKKYVILVTDGEDTSGYGTADGDGSAPGYYSNGSLPDEPGDSNYGKIDKYDPNGRSNHQQQIARNAESIRQAGLLAGAGVSVFVVGIGMTKDSKENDQPHLKVLRRVLGHMAAQDNVIMSTGAGGEYDNVARGKDNAVVGAGRAFFTATADDLLASLQQAFTTIIQDTESFTSPVVPSVRTTDNNKLYMCQFKPASSPETFWEGYLKSYNLLATGAIASTTWNWSADLQLNSDNRDYSSNARSIYTSRVSSGAWSRENFTTSNGFITDNVLGVASGTKNNLIDEVVKRASKAKRLGDTYHSTPVLVGAPNIYYNDPGFSTPIGPTGTQSFSQLYSQRKRVLYAGGNDGMLHAFNVGNWDTTLTPNAYNAGTGNELFGYIPNLVLGNLKSMTVAGNSSHSYFVDSPPKAADVWIDANGDNIQQSTEWKTVLIGGLRKGGRGYYALDITKADSATDGDYPKILWELSNSDIPKLGESWSEPAIGKVRINDAGTLRDRWVAFVGGGYWCPTLTSTVSSNAGATMTLSSVEGFAANDNVNINLRDNGGLASVNSGSKTLTLKASGNTNNTYPHAAGECVYGSSVGAGFYVIDIASGTVLWKLDNVVTAYGGDMMYPVAAAPVMVDKDTNSVMDTVYAIDVANQVWRFDLGAVGTYDSATKTVTAGWSGKRIFTPSSSTTARQPSFNKVEVAFDSARRPWVFFGTGDRERPETIGGGGSTGRIYSFLDNNPTSPITESNLANFSSVWTSAAPMDFTGRAGWYADLPNTDEKSLSDPVVFNNALYFTTFKPVTDNLCKGGGDPRLYGLKLSLAGPGTSQTAGAGAITDSDGHVVTSVLLLGGGIASNAVISMSANGGGVLYVSTSDPGGNSDTRSMQMFTIDAPSAFKKLKKWKERIAN